MRDVYGNRVSTAEIESRRAVFNLTKEDSLIDPPVRSTSVSPPGATAHRYSLGKKEACKQGSKFASAQVGVDRVSGEVKRPAWPGLSERSGRNEHKCHWCPLTLDDVDFRPPPPPHSLPLSLALSSVQPGCQRRGAPRTIDQRERVGAPSVSTPTGTHRFGNRSL